VWHSSRDNPSLGTRGPQDARNEILPPRRCFVVPPPPPPYFLAREARSQVFQDFSRFSVNRDPARKRDLRRCARAIRETDFFSRFRACTVRTSGGGPVAEYQRTLIGLRLFHVRLVSAADPDLARQCRIRCSSLDYGRRARLAALSATKLISAIQLSPRRPRWITIDRAAARADFIQLLRRSASVAEKKPLSKLRLKKITA